MDNNGPVGINSLLLSEKSHQESSSHNNSSNLIGNDQHKLVCDPKELEIFLKMVMTQNQTASSINYKTSNSSQNEPNSSKFNNNYYTQSNSNIITQNNLLNNINAKEWSYRYGRNGIIRPNIIKEDEELIRDHVDQMKKKKSIEAVGFEHNYKDISILYKNEEINERPKLEYFKEIALDKKLQINLEKMQFEKMTPIQKSVISYIIEGNDVMGCAQTGSGKTIAFLLPIINKMIFQGPPNVKDYKPAASAPVTLVLVPTRELAEQIWKETRKLITLTGMNVVKVYGGVAHEPQMRELKYGCDILVATPGRLLDFIESGLITLSAVQNFIIDEADRLLDMGFEPQINKIVFEVDMRQRERRQNLLFSATFSSDVKKMARNLMNEYYFISTYKESNTNANIKHILVYSNEEQKCFKLHMIMQQIQGSVIIFMDTKKGVDTLNNFLNNANYNAIAIHGDKSQIKRLEAIEKFTNGDVPILIATDVASRGLDFPSVSYVINFEMPTNIEDYVHRIGRTGRCGNSGVAISFINEINKPIITDLHSIMKKLNQEIPEWFEKMHYNFRDYKPGSYYNKYQNNNNNAKFGGSDKRSSFIGKRERYDSKNDDRKPYKSYSNSGSSRSGGDHSRRY